MESVLSEVKLRGKIHFECGQCHPIGWGHWIGKKKEKSSIV